MSAWINIVEDSTKVLNVFLEELDMNGDAHRMNLFGDFDITDKLVCLVESVDLQSDFISGYCGKQRCERNCVGISAEPAIES